MRFAGVVVRALVVVGVLVAATPGTAGATNDPLFPRQWNLVQIGAPRAWAHGTGSRVLVGVVDTGVDVGHPDLAGKVAATADCLNIAPTGACREGGGDDDNGHGTSVSGIVAAVTGNGRGVAAVAPDARLLVAKALDGTGSGRAEDINAAVRWVVDRGAKVVNLSVGDPDFPLTSALGSPLRPAVEYAWARGAVPVVASGNYRGTLDPGSSNYGDLDVMVVGATGRDGTVSEYSSAIGNAKWGLVAPGGVASGTADDNVITTGPGGGYEAVAGTSAAAPHVAGALAVLLSMGLGPAAAVQRVLATLDRSVPCGRGCQGRLDLGAATAGGGPPPPTTAAPVRRSPPPPAPATTALPPPTAVAEQPAPVTPVAAGRRASAADDEGEAAARNPAVVGAAVMLVLGMGSAVGAVSWARRPRLRAGAGR